MELKSGFPIFLVAEEFCDITFQYLHGNFKSRAYSSAARKLPYMT